MAQAKRKKKKFSKEFLEQQFQKKGEEANTKLISFRIPPSLKEKMDKFKEDHGRYPWEEIREVMDQQVLADY
jgi:hypothetical protein